jgi:hypothetical protein
MLSEAIPLRSAKATAARSTRSRLSGTQASGADTVDGAISSSRRA